MDKYEKFYSCAQRVADEFRKIDAGHPIRIISHLDADGLSSCSILTKAMKRAGRQYTVSIVQKLDEALAESLANEPFSYIAFTDLGSGQFNLLKKIPDSKTIYIFDHHKPESFEEIGNIVHLNPHLFEIDGSKEVSGAGVAYLFSRALDARNRDMAHIAIIGAIGDVQENNGFERVNTDILKDAVESGKMKVIQGLKLFGAQTKPLHNALAYSTEHNIPGVTGSESGAIQFLHQLGISPKNGDSWRSLVDLDDRELKNLVTGILMRRLNEKEPEAIIGRVYILLGEEKKSPLRDAKEFSTLLNACGRMDKSELGIGACLGDEKLKAQAIAHLALYKKEIVKGLTWFEKSYSSGEIIRGRNYIIINAGRQIMHTMIGTLASILSKSNYLGEGTFILSMAQIGDGNTKVSIRLSGSSATTDLRGVISGIVEKVDGSFGGHMGAAGAIIATDREGQFIEEAKSLFEKTAITP
ncbi:DHH family phosphoesterase [Candidatus Woesearchaeota archaeon]|nr:DHH family phosphoesterase [Candidatus Woesearchaeota archaeon]